MADQLAQPILRMRVRRRIARGRRGFDRAVAWSDPRPAASPGVTRVTCQFGHQGRERWAGLHRYTVIPVGPKPPALAVALAMMAAPGRQHAAHEGPEIRRADGPEHQIVPRGPEPPCEKIDRVVA